MCPSCWVRSKALAKPLGIKVPLEPVKGYSITVDAKEWRLKPRMPIIDESRHAAVCPLGSRLRIAGTAEFAGFNADMVTARIDNLSDVCEALFPFTKNIARDSDVSMVWLSANDLRRGWHYWRNRFAGSVS